MSDTPAPEAKILLANLPPGPQLDRAVWRIVRGPWDRARCPVCGGILYPDVSLGCIVNNCARRPVPDRRADAAPSISQPVTDADKAALLDVFLWIFNSRDLIWFVAWGGMFNRDLHDLALRTCRAVLAAQGYQYALVLDDGRWMLYHG